MAAASAQAGAARLTRNRLRSAVTRAGRQRRIEAETDRLLEVFRRTWLRQPTLIEKAMGRQTLALLAQLDAACQACDDLAHDTEELFLQHPDAEIITSRSETRGFFVDGPVRVSVHHGVHSGRLRLLNPLEGLGRWRSR
ncbi:hypothetical protein ACFY20_44225 [Streptomyces sp. NPDC001312]|uniref:hypothetical protein n=1 Tax=Streptomyces sp. NPDC001312 TaxID=3364561 RepID=UPI00367A9141